MCGSSGHLCPHIGHKSFSREDTSPSQREDLQSLEDSASQDGGSCAGWVPARRGQLSAVPDVGMCEKEEAPIPGTSQRNGLGKWETINLLGIWKPRAIQLSEIVNTPSNALSWRDLCLIKSRTWGDFLNRNCFFKSQRSRIKVGCSLSLKKLVWG